MDIDGEHIAGLQLLDSLQLARGDSQNANLPSDNVNISDVLEAVGLADPENGAVAAGAGGLEMAQRPPAPQATVQIVEQPAPKALRFRYECEGRSAGSIPGVNSTSENKTYPTIRINGFTGHATIVVSCVTKDHPYRPHPHNLVGREGCHRGVFTIKAAITSEANEYQFRNLGIQCVKRRDIAEALQQRHELRVDPFRTGFDHRNNPQSIDLNAVRLAFQVFLHRGDGQLYSLPPIVSDVIYDKKAMCDLLIMRSSHCSGPVAGGTQIILLCEKVTREDTAVVFYQEDAAGQVIWETVANLLLVHKQVAIVFETPPYKSPHYDRATHRGQILVRFKLRRISDNVTSNSLEFEYIPDFQDSKKRKAIMAGLEGYDTESYQLEPPIKIEPNRTPPHNIYSPAGPSYSEAQAQWPPLDPMPMYGEGWQHAAPPPQPQYQQYGQASYLRSPHHQQAGQPGSPMGPVSPATQAGLMSPMAPTVQHGGHSPHMAHGAHSPHMAHGAHSPHMVHGGHSPQQVGPGGPALSPGLYQQGSVQPAPTYQLNQQMAGGDHMDTGTSISALLNQNAGQVPTDFELISLSLEQTQENLSDSLRNLSTTDLFRNSPLD